MPCNCDMRTKLVGDGCETCNPAKALEYAKERIDELEAERDALAAQVVAMRDALQMVATARTEDDLRGEQCDNGYSPEYVAQQALSIDTSAAEAILRDREAKALESEREEIIAAIPGGSSVDPQWVCDMIRARGWGRNAAEHRACQECGMIGTHKRQCSTGGQTQLVLPAEREGK